MDLETLVKINKGYFIESSTVALKAQLVGLFPFILIPPWSFVYDKLAAWFIKKLADGLELIAFFKYTDLRVSKQGNDYVNAKIKGLEAELSGDPAKIKAAEDEIKDKFRAFVKFTT